MTVVNSGVFHHWQLACARADEILPVDNSSVDNEAVKISTPEQRQALTQLPWTPLDHPMPVAAWMMAFDHRASDSPAKNKDAINALQNRFPAGTGSVDIDDWDWLYRCQFSAAETGRSVALVCEGLAGLCEIWLNGSRLGTTDNMFRRYHFVFENLLPENLLPENNELLLVFRSVNGFLAAKRPRPRWKTRLVDHQNLRYLRRTLFGRIPGWTPAQAAVGPYRPLYLQVKSLQVKSLQIKSLQVQTAAALESLTVSTRLQQNEGRVGIVALVQAPANAVFEATINGVTETLKAHQQDNGWVIEAELAVANPRLWWPTGEGEQGENTLILRCHSETGTQELAQKTLRFKTVSFDHRGNGAGGWQINGKRVFIRGACWTVGDIRTLACDENKLEAMLKTFCAAGMNAIRVGGTMLYESDAFYRWCDRLGILVWQDFMFANMDYPFDDDEFRVNCETEIVQQLQRLAEFGCVFAYCGGSEIEQQAAMTGVAREHWRHPFLGDRVPELCNQYHPGTVYFPSTPCDGAMPFFSSEGITHYYGVGAYLREFSDLFVADVRFASECLAFANIPGPALLKKYFGRLFPPPHHPDWKAGVCRDEGAGWDFEDVRDHYLKTLFDVDPIDLRYQNLERYYALSEVVSGEVMCRVFQFWRSSLSRCSGAFVWYLNDVLPGAGWGLIDVDGDAKPALFIAAQALQPLQIVFVDKGLEGYWLEVVNESQQPLQGQLRVELWQSLSQAHVSVDIELDMKPGSSQGWLVEQLLGGFHDVGHTYRFGPRSNQLITARLFVKKALAEKTAPDQTLLAQAEIFTGSYSLTEVQSVSVQAQMYQKDDHYWLELESSHFLQRACVQLRGFKPVKNYLNLIAGQRYAIDVIPEHTGERFRGSVSALNCSQIFSIHSP